ncbi:MAG: hypothetical protein IT585_04785 [candidate division Zixibacteria bacterium]|nr:hypothetical protein [candidate division Zixibacteria bacterium]
MRIVRCLRQTASVLLLLSASALLCLEHSEDARGQELDPGHLYPDSVAQLVVSDRFQYGMGYWSELSHTSDRDREPEIRKQLHNWLEVHQGDERTSLCFESDAFIVDRFSSSFLKSAFFLVSFRREGRPSFALIFAIDSLGSREELFTDNETSVAYLESDLLHVPADSVSRLQLSHDLVRLAACYEFPSLVLESACDIWEYSNGMLSKPLWEAVAQYDSIRRIVCGHDLNRLMASGLLAVYSDKERYKLAEFEKYESLVRSPSFVDSETVVMYKWSPHGGRLTEWRVQFLGDQRIHVTGVLLERGLGYCFTFM